MAHQLLPSRKSCALKDWVVRLAVCMFCTAYKPLHHSTANVCDDDEDVLHVHLPQGNAVSLRHLYLMGSLDCVLISNLELAKHLTKLVIHHICPRNFAHFGWPADMANLQHIESDYMPFLIPQDVCNYSNLRVLAWNNCTADAVTTANITVSGSKFWRCAAIHETVPVGNPGLGKWESAASQ